MSEVTVTIAGRNYTVACADGEESHVAELGAVLDEKLQQLGGSLSTLESQNLLFAGLFVADDLHEAKKQVAAAEEATRAAEEAVATHQREANLALGMRDQLNGRIGDLEAELDGMQSAQQLHNAEVDDLRREVRERRQEACDAAAERDALAAQAAQARDNAARFEAQFQALSEERDNLAAQVERLGSMSAVVAASGGHAAPDDLAPALERFAELLEECAEKLESKATTA